MIKCIHINYSISTSSISSISDGVEELLGFTPEQFYSGEISLQDRFHADDHDIRDIIFSTDIELNSGICNVRLRQANGRIRCVKCLYSKSKGPNNQTLLEITIHDAKSLYEEPSDNCTIMPAYKAMIENTNDYIYFKDRNHVFTGASQTLVALTSPSEHWTDLLGQTDYDVFPEELADIYYKLEKDVFSGVSVANEVQKILDSNGNEGWVDNRKFPMKSDDGELIGLFGVARVVTEEITIKKALQTERDTARHYFDTANIMMLVLSKDETILQANKKACEVLGYSEEELKSMNWFDSFLLERDVDSTRALFSHIMTGKVEPFEAYNNHIRVKDGSERVITWSNSYSKDSDGNISTVISSGDDITRRVMAESRVSTLSEALNSAGDSFILSNLKGQIIDANEFSCESYGYSREELLSLSVMDLDSNYKDLKKAKKLWKGIIEGKPITRESEHRRKDGRVFPCEIRLSTLERDGENFILGVCRDISKRKSLEHKLENQAHIDYLTGLYNRRFFIELGEMELAKAFRHERPVSAFMLDIDFFKQVNDSHGHKAGDIVLQQLSEICLRILRKCDIIGRWGGEEFVVLLPETGLKKAAQVAERLRAAIAKAEVELTSNLMAKITVSIGVTELSGKDASLDSMFSVTDKALYQAKELGRNKVVSLIMNTVNGSG